MCCIYFEKNIQYILKIPAIDTTELAGEGEDVMWASLVAYYIFVYMAGLCRKSMRVSYSLKPHYCDAIMGAMASLITDLTSVYSTVHSGADQSKHQSSASLAFVRGSHRRPANSPHKWPVTRKMFPFDDVIMGLLHFGFSKIELGRSMTCLVMNLDPLTKMD